MRITGIAGAVAVAASFVLGAPAYAGTVTLCPSMANAGGINATVSFVSGPLDGTCGANSAVQIDIPASTDYGRLAFTAAMTGYPAGLTLSGLTGLSADVLFSSAGSDGPYFMLQFTDTSNSVGQTTASDQILMLEFQSNALLGTSLAMDPASTLFNLYDNTTGTYLQGGQQDAHTLDYWLSLYPALGNNSLDGIRIGEGLTGGNSGPESLTVNSLAVKTADVPEPSTIALLGAALLGFGLLGRRRWLKKARG